MQNKNLAPGKNVRRSGSSSKRSSNHISSRSNLLQARRRAGLEPKQVAFLLDKKSSDELYRYEKDENLPNLLTALKLEIIYQAPVRLLFQDLFALLKEEIDERRKSRPRMFTNEVWFPNHTRQLSQEEHCFYGELLQNRFPSPLEMEMTTKHIIALMKTLSDYKQGLDPFSLGAAK